jgi:hypothetical protein
MKTPTRTQYIVGTVANAGLAYFLYKHGHKNWAAFFALNTVLGAVLAAGAKA